MPFRPDPKPPGRIRNPDAGKGKLQRERHCRLCGQQEGRHAILNWKGRPAPGNYRWVKLSRHHLVPRSQGGDDVDANLVPLCGDGTRGCHHAVESWQPGAREQLRERLRSEEVAYIIGKRGAGWLDRNYPVATPAPAG